MPKSTAVRRPSGVDEQIALMHVGVEETVAHGVTQEGLDDDAAKVLQVVALGGERVDVGERDAIHPFEGQHLPGGAVPVDPRHAKIHVFGAIFGEFRRRRRLQAKIHLHFDRARQRVDDLDRPQAADIVEPALGELAPRNTYRRDRAGTAARRRGAEP